jgi:selenide,water dikinase
MSQKASAVRLTSLASCAGCAAKMRPDALARVLGRFSKQKRRDVLVGLENADDAAVVQLNAHTAIVETVDFFPPIVDDPHTYGAIAAANAMSDVWAMGGRALFGLNVVGIPKGLDEKILRAILAGGAAKAAEAGVPVLGGHTIHSAEPIYGMAVTGVVHPKKVLRKSSGKTGDLLILTKPLGTGIATTAIKRGLAPRGLIRDATAQMTRLNKTASEVFVAAGSIVHALTDVTGFGLLGHLLEMCRGAKLRAFVDLERVPMLPGIAALSEREIVPGGTRTNLEHVSRWTNFPEGLPAGAQWVLADAQTNGGLLAAVAERSVGRIASALERRGIESWIVGQLGTGRVGIDVV